MEKIYFSPGQDCLNGIIESLSEAKKSIKICVFTISDNRIAKVIRQKFEAGIDVKIISDNDKRFDKGSDVIYLSKLGVPTKIDRTKAHMHHKFAVVDEKITITGSYNWTRSAEKYNYENILITKNREIVTAFNNKFNQLWMEMLALTPEKLEVGKWYPFTITNKTIDKFQRKFYVFTDSFGGKNLVPCTPYEDYNLKIGNKIQGYIDGTYGQDEIFIEPENPLYKIGTSYEFDFYGVGKRITKENKEIDVLIVLDNFENQCTVLPNNEYQKTEAFRPKKLECKVVRIKRSRLYLENMNK